MQHFNIVCANVFSLCCILLLSGCGIDDSDVLSGTVAAGAPLIGTVTIKDSSSPAQTRSAAIEADGTYRMDISGLAAPFMLRANGIVGGRAYSLHSAGTAADAGGNINITPLTDLIVANIAQETSAGYYGIGDFTSITTDNLAAAETNLQTRLQPIIDIIGLASSIDFLHTRFAADHTGMDALLDVLRVTVDPNTLSATIRNKITTQQLDDDFTVPDEIEVMDTTTNVAARVADFQQIAGLFTSLSNSFASSPLGLGALQLLDTRPGEFKDDGRDSTAYLSALTSDSEMLGAKFTHVVLESFTTASTPTSARVNVSLVRTKGMVEPLEFTINKVPFFGWRIAGNQRMATAKVASFAFIDNLDTISSGLKITIQDKGSAGVDYAVVTGSGLPTALGGADGASAGLLLFNTGSGIFQIAASGVAYAGSGTTAQGGERGHYPISDSIIPNLVDNSTYTVELWDDNATPGNLSDDIPRLAMYSDILAGKMPYESNNLTTTSFAEVTTAGAAILSAASSGGNLAVDWNLPSGLQSSKVRLVRTYISGSTDETVQFTSGSATSANLILAAPTDTVDTVGLYIHARDVFNRELIRYAEY